MKSLVLPLLIAASVSSCTTAYNSGQTPDDVYYSPERPQQVYAQTDRNDERTERYDRYDRYDTETYDDRYLRMRVRNRRWSMLDDGYYTYNPYFYRNYNNYLYLNSPWNQYTYWNHYYNPYYNQVIVVNPKSPVYNKPRTTNLHVFDQNQNNYNPKAPRSYGKGSSNASSRGTDYRGSGQDAGRSLRESMRSSRPSSSSGSNTSSTPVRTSSSGNSSKSSGSGSSSGSKSGGSAPVRKF